MFLFIFDFKKYLFLFERKIYRDREDLPAAMARAEPIGNQEVGGGSAGYQEFGPLCPAFSGH